MKTELIRIGNSRGVRIPKPLIEECGLGETVELRVVNQSIVVSPVRAPRAGWAEAFRRAGASSTDELLLDLPESEFDRSEWQW
jgi:antitoxin MazE